MACLKLKSVEGIEGSAGLERLELVQCPSIEDANVLEDFTSLSALILAGCRGISSYGFLRNLHWLKELQIFGSNEDFDAALFTEMDSLESVVLAEVAVINLEMIGSLGSIKRLSIAGRSSLEDVSILSGLRNLEQLDLVGCRNVTNISALGDLPALKRIVLHEATKAAAVPESLRPIVSWVEDRQWHRYHYRYRFVGPRRYVVRARGGAAAYYMMPRWVSDDGNFWEADGWL